MKKKRLVKGWIGASIIGLVIVGIPLAAHYRAKWRLETYERQLKEAGEKLTPAQLKPVFSPDELKAGIDLLAAGKLFRFSYSNAPLMRILAPGRALAACRQETMPTEESTNVWPDLEFLLGQNEDALAHVRRALSVSAFGFNVDYNDTANFSVPHLARMKALTQWLSMAVTVELHAGDITNAWEDLDALAKLVAGYNREFYMISELVRLAMAAISINTTWEALQCPGWTDEQLRSIQARWESVDLLTQAESALAMERPFAEAAFAAGRRSFNAVNFQPGGGGSGLSELAQIGKEVLEQPEKGLKTALHRYAGYWGWKYWQSYEDELVNSKALHAAIKAVRRARSAASAGVAVSDFTNEAARLRKSYPSAGRWFGYSSLDSLERFLVRIRTIEIERSLLITAIALKRYEIRQGEYPADLSALSPAFIAQIPRDPIDGEALRYRRNTDGTFLLYSIGEDGVDNDGNSELSSEAPKQWWRARDAVWPWPATPEQTQAELRKMNEKLRATPSSANTILESFRKRYGLQTAPGNQKNSVTNQ